MRNFIFLLRSVFGSILKEKELVILAAILFLGLALRLYNLPGNVLFTYDQTRDAQRVYDMIYNHDFKLVGPETDIPGIFHGVFYYYALAIFYFVSQFNPHGVVFFLTLINLSGIYLLYRTGKDFFSAKVGLLAAFIWAVSFEQISYSRFISNPSPMSVTTAIFFISLAYYIFKKNNKALVLSAIAYALSIHLNFFLLYLGIFYPIFYLIYRPKISLKHITASILTCTAILGSFIISELKWGFTGTHSLIAFANNRHGGLSMVSVLERYIDKLYQTLSLSFLPNHFYASMVFFLLLVIAIWIANRSRKKELLFIYVWIFSTFPLFFFQSGVHTTPWINASLFGGLALFFSIAANTVIKKVPTIILIIVGIIFLSLNINQLYQDKFENVRIFAIQRMLLKDTLNVVDYAYKNSSGKPFSICAVSSPLFINTNWSFTFGLYGNKKYGYLPFWSGQEQHLNKNNLPLNQNRDYLHFLIIEPQAGIPEIATKITIYTEDKITNLEDEKAFGLTRIQKRRYPQKAKFTDTQNLSENEIDEFDKILNADPRYNCFEVYR